MNGEAFIRGRLKDFCSSITDGTHASPSTVDEGYAYVTVRDIQEGRVRLETAERIGEEDFRRLERDGCRPGIGDLLFSKDGTIGKVALCDRDDFVVLSSLAILRPRSSIDPRYLKFVLESSNLLQQVEAQMAGAALRRITLDKIVYLKAQVPLQRSVQNRIANFLDEQTARIDALIAEKERLKKSLSDFQYSYASNVMTRGLNPNVSFSASSFPEIGACPSHWSIKRLKFLGEIRSVSVFRRPH